MEPTLEVFSTQINIVGSFNPPVISPGWLAENELIGKADCDYAIMEKSLAITPEICRFETEWFSLQIIQQQFILTSKGAVTPALKDLAVGIFTLLEHTPVTAVGINSMAHFKTYSTKDYHRIGDVLAPKSIWHSVFAESANQSVGLQQMVVSVNGGPRDSQLTPMRKNVIIGPSNEILNGLHFVLNDHFTINSTKEPRVSASDHLIKIINENLQNSMDEAKASFATVIRRALDTKEMDNVIHH